MTYRVLLTDRAQRDVDRIVEWPAERAPAGAAKWLTALENSLASLEQLPERFAKTLKKDFPNRDIRQAVFKTKSGHRYWLVYCVVGAPVFVVHVRGAGQVE